MFKRVLSLAGFCVLTSVAFVTPSASDVVPFNGSEVAPNIAVISVEDTGIKVELEIYVNDVDIFIDVVPALWVGMAEESHLNDQGRIERFGNETLVVSAEDGAPLPLSLSLVEPRMRIDRSSPLAGETDPYTGQVVPSPPEDQRVIFAELFYAFGPDRPDQITIVPPQSEGEAIAVVGMQVNDRSVPVTEFRYLSKPATLLINWADPWHSSFSSPSLNRKAQNGTTSFLYVEPREVRHEILIRIRELAPWIDETFQVGDVLDSSRRAEIVNAAVEAMRERNPVSIDGVTTKPEAVRASFLTLNQDGFQVSEVEETLTVDNTFLGLILTYPHAELPSEVTLDWKMFDDQISRVPVTLTDAAGPFFDEASEATPRVTWTNHLKKYVDPQVVSVPLTGLVAVPAITLGAIVLAFGIVAASLFVTLWPVRLALLSIAGICAVAGYATRNAHAFHMVSPMESRSRGELVEQALANLLNQIYVAALEVTPSDRAAALAQITTEAGNAELANELESNLAIRVPGGGLAMVTEIDEVSVEGKVLPVVGPYEGLAHWRVDARASHWGHDHRRQVEYRARVTMIPKGGQWKFVALTVLEANSPDA